MRRFLKNVLVFGCIMLVLAIIGELIVRRIESSYNTKNREIRERGEAVNTLILGSSHTYYGLIPEELGDSVFNLANISQSPEYDLALLNYYMPYLGNVKRLIVPISYFTYRDPRMEDGDEWKLAIPYKTRMGLDLHSDFSIYNLEIADFDVYKGRLANIFLRKPSNRSTESGFGLGYDIEHRDPLWKNEGAHHAERHTQAPGRFESVLETQDSLMRMAHEHGWEVIFITTPASEAYTAFLDPSQEAEMLAGADSLQKRYGVRYFNFLRDKRFGDDDFYDADHLNSDGAAKFSLILRDSLGGWEKAKVW